MNCIKTDSRNRLSQEWLEIQIKIGEEGAKIEDFVADPFIEKWFDEKVCRLNGAKPHNYPSKRKSTASSTKIIDIAGYTLSDLEEDTSDLENEVV